MMGHCAHELKVVVNACSWPACDQGSQNTSVDEEMVLQVSLLEELLGMDGYWKMESQFT